MPDETSDQPGSTTAADDAQAALDEARRRLADAPVSMMLANHVMGIYELAAIHLSAQPPDLGQSSLAIDAMSSLVDGLGARLDEIDTLRDALANIRIVYVQVAGSTGKPADGGRDDAPRADDDTLGE